MTASITIDVDGIGCYRAIHGLPDVAGHEDPIFASALPRFLDLIARLNVRVTLFVIGRDLQQPTLRSLVSSAHDAGHEIASHSDRHDYALSQKAPAVIEADLNRAAHAIFEITGDRPRGFRAPGYNLSEALLDAVENTGHEYDSSIFPAPSYFALRASAIFRYRQQGRPSHSLRGDAREFAGPRAPYRPAIGARWRPAKPGEGQRSLLEIPMSVATPARLPWIGTSVALSPSRVSSVLTGAVLRRPEAAVFELHALDFLAKEDGVEPALALAQPDLRVPLKKRLRRLERVLERVVGERQVRPLAELAADHRAALSQPLVFDHR